MDAAGVIDVIDSTLDNLRAEIKRRDSFPSPAVNSTAAPVEGEVTESVDELVLMIKESPLSDQVKQFLRLMLHLENEYNGESFFRLDPAGKFRGVAQLSKRTWTDIVRIYGLPYPSWEEGALSPHYSLMVAAQLWYDNRRAFARKFPTKPFTREIAYLYHQQGAGAAARYLQSGKLVYPRQSQESLRTMAQGRGKFVGEDSPLEVSYPKWV